MLFFSGWWCLQCNNMYVFPGIGLAASVAGMKTITDRMLYR